MQVVFWILLFLAAVILHEVCHGLVAWRLGDPTAKEAGRLTLNPLKHIDPFWTVIFPGLLFLSTQGRFAIGMAKPVPVNFSRLRSPRRDMILVAAAGPAANLLLAGTLAFFWKLTAHPFLLYGIYFNLGIAAFNLVPVPPLDGSRIVTGLLPARLARYYLLLEPLGFALVFILYMTGFLFMLVLPMMDFFCRILDVPAVREFLALQLHGGAF